MEFVPTPAPSNDPGEIANLVVTWSGVVLAAFALYLTILSLVFVVATFFGVRELRSIRAAGQRARVRAERQTELAKSLMEEWQESLLDMQSQIKVLVESVDERLNTVVQVAYLFNQGEEAYDRGEYEKAVDYLERAVELDPKSVSVRYRLGRALTNLDRNREAVDQFVEAAELGMPEGAPYRGMAQAERYEHPDFALERARQAVEHGPDVQSNWNCLGLILRDHGHFDEARQAHQRAASLNDDWVTTHFYLALLEARAHRFQWARHESARAMTRLEVWEPLDKIKPLWSAMIRWVDAVLQGEFDRADECATQLSAACTSKRRAAEVCAHVDFLLRALGKEEFWSRYGEPIGQQRPHVSAAHS